MKKTLAVFSILSMLTLSGCVLGVSTAHPPHVGFYGHPSLVVIPGTYVYAMTDIGEDIYFHTGWWWRLWDGRWYKSRYYDRGWNHYRGVPGFYHEVDPGWRDFYRHRRWHGHPWECERIPAPRVQQDWDRWQNSHYWEKEKNWGVRGYRPAPYRHSDRESMRDDSRFPHQDRHEKSRLDDRRHRTGQMQPDRREFSSTREDSRSGQPFFENRRKDDRETETRDRERYRERQKNQSQQFFERPRRDDGDDETTRGRQYGDQQDHRRNRPAFQEERRESGEMPQQRREQYRERQEDRDRTPMFGPRQQEAKSERFQRNDDAESRQPRFKSRQREAGQDKPQRQERNRDNRKRPQQGFPGQDSGQPGTSAGDTSGITQFQ